MKNYFLNKTRFVFVLALIAQFSAFADSKEISKAKDFVSYCGTGSRYKSCDDIILTDNIELTSDITLRKNLKIRSKDGSMLRFSPQSISHAQSPMCFGMSSSMHWIENSPSRLYLLLVTSPP